MSDPGGVWFNARIKWPNDVLLNRRKVCGILAESVWMGESVDSVVVGIGINVGKESVPPEQGLNFPATCVETEAEVQHISNPARVLDRAVLLHGVIQSILGWRQMLASPLLIRAWNQRLAFKGEAVEVWAEGQPPRSGALLGLESDGSLRLSSALGEIFTLQFGEVHLRPVV